MHSACKTHKKARNARNEPDEPTRSCAPKSVDFMAELPRHPTGKLYKRLLRDKYWEGAGRKL